MPDRVAGRTESYVAVPMPPPPLRPERIPARPASGDTRWVDGEWSWDGTRYQWQNGAWVIPPPGARLAPWAVVRRNDGQLFYAPSTWLDEKGEPVPGPEPIAEGYIRERDGGAEAPASDAAPSPPAAEPHKEGE